MAKGSVRKKGKKWYYRFYVEDASGNSVQREFPGSESKSETEAMLRKAMADYEEKQFVAKSENLTLAGLLDKWIEEELKPGSLSNGTVAAYIDTARRIKKHPIADRNHIAGSQFKLFETAHMMFLEEPDSFNAIVTEFLG